LYYVCEDYIIALGDNYIDNPWTFRFYYYFLYGVGISKEVIVEVYPLTAGVGVLSIDRGGIRGIVPLKLIKLIED
jgi:hypothetical protein